MAGKYQGYPKYKDSGIECLGMLPSHWVVQSLSIASKRISVGLATSVTEYYRDEGVPIIRNMNIKDGYFDGSDMLYLDEKFAAANSGKVVHKGDVIAVHTGSNLGLACIVPDEFDNCHTFTTLIVKTSEELFNKYLTYCINSAYGKAEVHRLKFGFGKDNLNVKEFKCFYTLIPEYFEQQKIANFLDHETAKIDTLIEKQQQLIALLKEKRQAVISHAVTKGLNANVPMRDSGVEWLGEVPEHWDVVKLSYRYKVLLGKMLDDKKIKGDYLGSYLRNTDVQWDRINTEGLPKMDFRPEEQQRYSVSKGDLIVCEGGEIGRCAIWEKEVPCFYQKALHRLRPLDEAKDETRFMFYVLFDAVHQERFSGGVAKATIAHLPAETFRQYKFAYPPYEEQLKTSSFLDDIKVKFEAIELSAENQIDLLQERRTALITAAVTGKIDVRSWKQF